MNLGDLLSHLFSPSQQLRPGHTNTRYGREPVAVSNLSLVDPDRPPATRLPTEPSAASGTIRVSPPSEPLQLMTPQLAARYMGSGSADLACFALQLYAQRRRSAARLARWLDTAYCDGLSPLVHRRSTLESLPSISVMHRQLCRPCSAALRSAAPPRRSPHSASRRSSDTTSKYGLYPFRKHRSTCQHDGSRRSEGMQSETLGWRKLREIVDYTLMHLPYKRRYQMSRLDERRQAKDRALRLRVGVLCQGRQAKDRALRLRVGVLCQGPIGPQVMVLGTSPSTIQRRRAASQIQAVVRNFLKDRRDTRDYTATPRVDSVISMC